MKIVDHRRVGISDVVTRHSEHGHVADAFTWRRRAVAYWWAVDEETVGDGIAGYVMLSRCQHTNTPCTMHGQLNALYSQVHEHSNVS